jgi:hypothetical protein
MQLRVMSFFEIDLRHLEEDTTQDMFVEVYVG